VAACKLAGKAEAIPNRYEDQEEPQSTILIENRLNVKNLGLLDFSRAGPYDHVSGLAQLVERNRTDSEAIHYLDIFYKVSIPEGFFFRTFMLYFVSILD
jgi:hypothetical protein